MPRLLAACGLAVLAAVLTACAPTVTLLPDPLDVDTGGLGAGAFSADLTGAINQSIAGVAASLNDPDIGIALYLESERYAVNLVLPHDIVVGTHNITSLLSAYDSLAAGAFRRRVHHRRYSAVRFNLAVRPLRQRASGPADAHLNRAADRRVRGHSQRRRGGGRHSDRHVQRHYSGACAMIELLDGIYGFTGMIVGRVYAIRDPDGLTLIDSGLARSAGRIVKQVEAAGFKANDIKRIVITHAHVDHGGGAHALNALTGAAIMVSAAEADVSAAPPNSPGRPIIASTYCRASSSPSPVAREPHDGDVIDDVLGGLTVVATPGHTLGHLSFWSPQRRVLFTGDVLLHTLGLRFPLPMVTISRAMCGESVKTRIAPLGPDALLFGHGPPILSGAAARIDTFIASRGL
ncbi:MAG: MBL fold metallo-hydrolase [Chloroflexi bacterium]|nr:MBL fold metallo-hydrolase [Chloroflexota bacterium]